MARWIKPATAVLLVVYMIVLILSVRVHEARDPSRFDRLMAFLAAPVQNLVWSSSRGMANIWQGYIWLTKTARTNEELIRERDELTKKVASLRDVEEENHRLKALLDLPSKSELKLLVAQRIAFGGGSPYEHLIRVSRGEADGVKRGQAVLHPLGVVGQVVQVRGRTADILLLADLNSAIDGVSQRSRARGILKGAGLSALKLDYLSPKDDLKVGDEIVSSGLDGVYPKGIPIGTVTKIDPIGKALFTSAQVKPAMDYAQIEEVAIVLGAQP